MNTVFSLFALFYVELTLMFLFLDDLEEVSLRIYGQPFVGLYLIPYLKYHFLIDKLRAIQPSKPLVLRFYGPVGVGKTLVAERLSKMSYFRNKHFISSKADFHLKDGASLLIHKVHFLTVYVN